MQIISDSLATSGLSPERLELEITESVLLTNNSGATETLHALRRLGVRISMDDFGTGYSSLSYLRSFPFDKIKIDQSFIRDLGTTERASSIVRAIISICGSMGMVTTAEGVETEEQVTQLRMEGCNEVQGYYFSCAVAEHEILPLIARLKGMARLERSPTLVPAGSDPVPLRKKRPSIV